MRIWWGFEIADGRDIVCGSDEAIRNDGLVGFVLKG